MSTYTVSPDGHSVSFTIPLPPVSKKNSQQIFYKWSAKKQKQIPFIAPSKQYKTYEHNAMILCPRIKIAPGPITVKCLFYMPTHRKCDLVNLLEAIDDVLVKRGMIEDDNFTIIASHDGSRVLYDPDNPRTEVYLSRFEEV